MIYDAAQAAYKLAFEISPITLVGGIAGAMSGGALPISALLNGGSSLLNGATTDADSAFGHFYPLPGTGLIENQVGEYPFANQAVAANAIIKQPLTVSLLMHVPANVPGGHQRKLAVLTALQNSIANHCAQGGLFIVATPSFHYNDLLLVGLHDVSGGETMQAQVTWRWDFRKPLVRLAGQTPNSMNSFMQRLSSGVRMSGAMTGRELATPASLGAPVLIPSAGASISAGVPSGA